MPRVTIAVLLLSVPSTGFGQALPPDFDLPAAEVAPLATPPREAPFETPLPHPLAAPGEPVYDPYGPNDAVLLLPPAPFRTTPLALEPHDGRLLPGRGYAHYDAPSEHYGIWYRPDSFGRKCRERCIEPVWKPRGYGYLFARSSACQRMEYAPYELADYRTEEGPNYHPLPPDYTCCTLHIFWPSQCQNTDPWCGRCGGHDHGLFGHDGANGCPQRDGWLSRVFALGSPCDCRE